MYVYALRKPLLIPFYYRNSHNNNNNNNNNNNMSTFEVLETVYLTL
jgi:hypothetical protein